MGVRRRRPVDEAETLDQWHARLLEVRARLGHDVDPRPPWPVGPVRCRRWELPGAMLGLRTGDPDDQVLVHPDGRVVETVSAGSAPGLDPGS
jgi:hypothetical protein